MFLYTKMHTHAHTHPSRSVKAVHCSDAAAERGGVGGGGSAGGRRVQRNCLPLHLLSYVTTVCFFLFIFVGPSTPEELHSLRPVTVQHRLIIAPLSADALHPHTGKGGSFCFSAAALQKRSRPNSRVNVC